MRKLDFAPGEYYHVYNRGTDKRDIFLNNADKDRFIKLLYVCNSEKNIVFRAIPKSTFYFYDRGEQLVDIGAYCLMDNHFHLLVRERSDGGLAKFMNKLLTAYSMYFNKTNDRTGALFEGRFKAKHADTDEYLKYLFAYIHLNPVKMFDPLWKAEGIKDKAGASRYLDAYVYSSYFEYRGSSRKEGKIINREVFPEYFAKHQEFSSFLEGWIAFKDCG